jgi:hypothetical protein
MRKWLRLFEDTFAPDADEAEDARYAEQLRMEKTIREFCEKELGWSFDSHSHPIIFDDGEITIVPDEEEATLEELQKLSALGEVRVSASSRQWSLTIIIKAHQGLKIYQ